MSVSVTPVCVVCAGPSEAASPHRVAGPGHPVRMTPSDSGRNCGNTLAELTPNRADTTSASTER